MLLRVLGVSFSYGEASVLEEADLTVESGQIVGIIGPNGAGKTTLLRLVSGYLKPRMGRLVLDDEEMQRLTSRGLARKVAVVPQDTSSEFEFTVADIVRMGRNPHLGLLQPPSAEDESIVASALERTGLAALRDRPFTRLSGGERQRVLVARAIAQQPKLLLMDEPTAHLDLNFQIVTMTLVRSLGVAALMVMHDINLAAAFCDRMIMMKGGRVTASGTVHEMMIPDRIRDVFGIEATVTRHPRSGRPVVIV